MGPWRAATQCSTEKSFFGCCQLAEWDLIIGIMRTDFHCFNFGEGVRKEGLFSPHLGERMLSMASNWAPHLLGCCELSFLHLLFFMDAIRKGVRLVFCVGTSCKPGRMCPCKSMSVLASDPSSWAEVTWTESTGQICLFSALSKCFQVISESCLFPLFVLFLMQDLENSNYLLRSNIGEKF